MEKRILEQLKSRNDFLLLVKVIPRPHLSHQTRSVAVQLLTTSPFHPPLRPSDRISLVKIRESETRSNWNTVSSQSGIESGIKTLPIADTISTWSRPDPNLASSAPYTNKQLRHEKTDRYL